MRCSIFILALTFLVACHSGNDQSRRKLRESINFNENWYFCADSLKSGLKRGFQTNSLPGGMLIRAPHTWNIIPGLEDYYGWGWYQKHFRIPPGWEGSLIKLIFNSIYRDATIWINGNLALDREGSGYTPFSLVLNRYVNFDSINNITVLVDNSYSRYAIPMYSSFDWPNDGGLIRNISLVRSAPTAIDYVLIAPVYDESGIGIVRLTLFLESLSGEVNDNIDLWYNVTFSGKEILKGNKIVRVTGNRGELTIEIPGIELWHFNLPSLYRLNLAIGQNFMLGDHYSDCFGFRKLETDASSLIFNGEKVRLPGLEWMPGSDTSKGMAEDTASFHKMLNLLKNSGAVITRFHWPQDEAILDWCDRNGLLVQEELPLWARPYPGDIDDSVQRIISNQMREMVINHYNHPSIVSWGIGNELKANDPDIIDLLSKLKKEILSLDSTRLINYVSNTLHESPGKDGTAVGDIMMWNDYTGLWYGLGDTPVLKEDLGGILSLINKFNPDKPLVISEYGLCEPFFKGGDPERISHMSYHTSVYDTTNFVGGVIYFSLNDYRTHIGEEGRGKLRRRVHGVVDIFGDTKPSYDSLKKLFSPIRHVHLKILNNRIHVTGINHNGLPSYSLKGFKASLSEYESGSRIESVQLPSILMPGDKFNISFKAPAAGKYLVKLYAPNDWIIYRTEIIINN